MKNEISKRILLFLTAIVLLFTSTVSVTAEPTDATVQSFEKQIEEANNRIGETLRELTDIRNRRASAWEEIAKIDELIAAQNQLKKLAEHTAMSQVQSFTKYLQIITKLTIRVFLTLTLLK